MKCSACGYEKIGFDNVQINEQYEYYKSGNNKGQIKKTIPAHVEYLEIDPDKKEFIRIETKLPFL